MYEWFEKKDIGRKLISAAEAIFASGYYGAFEGLEGGEVTVKIVHNGEYIHFLKDPKAVKHIDLPVKEIPILIKTTAESVMETVSVKTALTEDEASKRSRKTKVENP